mmetsp:Transcript_6398/g.12717  ORF Transcript_6398/g.12717 Transcript_6398/m.12717 type:complete len:89 (-) Transcript_6398:113-379(-)
MQRVVEGWGVKYGDTTSPTSWGRMEEQQQMWKKGLASCKTEVLSLDRRTRSRAGKYALFRREGKGACIRIRILGAKSPPSGWQCQSMR